MEKLAMHSKDITQEQITKVAELFPNCITEVADAKGTIKNAIHFEKLKQELSDVIVEGLEEKYQLTWPGKRKAMLNANAPIAKTLRPYKEESVHFDTTQNLFIEGDNLDALKLLQETYLGKVKMIYIDPPYNTGKDFVYNDNFAESVQDYLITSGQHDTEGNRLVANTDTNGRFHSDWLSMMYPRLKLARNLLKDDGVIFISIDDNEVHNLRKICDEIFGEGNFVAEFPRITKKAGKSAKSFAKNNDSLLIFQKSSEMHFNAYLHTDEGYKFEDKYIHDRGKYKLNQTLDYGSIQYSPSLDYEIEIEGSLFRPGSVSKDEMIQRQIRNPKSDFCWRWSRELFEFGLQSGFIVVKKGKGGSRIYTKTYEKVTIDNSNGFYEVIQIDRTNPVSSLKFTDNIFSNDNSRKDINKLFEGKVFEYSKPVSLLKECCFLATQPNDIILDFFAGSATTAHAVMQLNAEDGGNRKFIMVQLPEVCKEDSEAYKAGYTTIAEISKERIRRAGTKIADKLEIADKAESTEGAFTLDIGFRVLKVDSSNMHDVYYIPDNLTQQDLTYLAENIKQDRTAEDLLFQVMLDWGIELSSPIVTEHVANCQVYTVDNGTLIACFEKDGKITEELCTILAKRQPAKMVFRDAGFAQDSVKINGEQIFTRLSPHTDLKTV